MTPDVANVQLIFCFFLLYDDFGLRNDVSFTPGVY